MPKKNNRFLHENNNVIAITSKTVLDHVLYYHLFSYKSKKKKQKLYLNSLLVFFFG